MHNIIVKERLEKKNFYHYVNFENVEVEIIEDDSEMNLFGTGLVECNEEITTLVRARLSQLYSSTYNKNGHNLLKLDLLAHFENAVE